MPCSQGLEKKLIEIHSMAARTAATLTVMRMHPNMCMFDVRNRLDPRHAHPLSEIQCNKAHKLFCKTKCDVDT